MKAIFYCSLCLLLCNKSFAQLFVLKGQVTIHNSLYKTGKLECVKKAAVKCFFPGTTATDTDDQGYFEIKCVGLAVGTIIKIYIEKYGLETVNTSDLEQVVIGRKDILQISMNKPGKIAKDQFDLYVKNKETIFKDRDLLISRLRSTIDESKKALIELNRKMGTEFTDFSSAIGYLNKKTDDLIAKLPSLAKDLTLINLDFSSDLYRNAYYYFESGDLKKTIELLANDKLEVIYKSGVEEKRQGERKIDDAINLYKLKSKSYVLLQNFTDAANAYLEAVTILEETNSPDNELIKSYIELGDIYKEGNQFAQAITFYTKAIKKDNNEILAYDGRGFCHWKLEHDSLALFDYDKVFNLAPTYPLRYNEPSFDSNRVTKSQFGVASFRIFFRGSSFLDCSFTRSNLTFCRVKDCNFTGTTFTGSILKYLVYDDKTIWPVGFNPIAVGAMPYSAYMKSLLPKIMQLSSNRIECMGTLCDHYLTNEDYPNALNCLNIINDLIEKKECKNQYEIQSNNGLKLNLLKRKAKIFESLNNSDSAKFYFKTALERSQTLDITDRDFQQVNCRLFLSKIFEKENDYVNAELYYDSSMYSYAKLDSVQKETYLQPVGSYLNSWIAILMDKEEYIKIDKLLLPLMKTYIGMNDTTNSQESYLNIFSQIQLVKANYFLEKKDYESCINYSNIAIQYSKYLKKDKSEALILRVLNPLITSQIARNEYSNAINTCISGLKLATEKNLFQDGCELLKTIQRAIEITNDSKSKLIIDNFRNAHCK